MSEYTLVDYDFNGTTVTSAIHWRDLGKFMRETPSATIRKA